MSYVWTDEDDNVLATTASYTPSTETAGEKLLTVTATNTLGGDTATASQTITVTVTTVSVSAG